MPSDQSDPCDSSLSGSKTIKEQFWCQNVMWKRIGKVIFLIFISSLKPNFHSQIPESSFSFNSIPSTSFFFFTSPAAANQRESLKSPFHPKEEPKVEEAPSPRPSSQCQGQVQPSFPGSFCQDGPTGAAAAMDPLKLREGSPVAKNSLLSQDINVKVASELLIKLSGRLWS